MVNRLARSRIMPTRVQNPNPSKGLDVGKGLTTKFCPQWSHLTCSPAEPVGVSFVVKHCGHCVIII